MRGSKFGRAYQSRAERSVRLLRDIGTMRALGYRNGTETEQESLRRHEAKLVELDEVHGYVRSSRGRRSLRPMGPGKYERVVSQGEYRRRS